MLRYAFLALLLAACSVSGESDQEQVTTSEPPTTTSTPSTTSTPPPSTTSVATAPTSTTTTLPEMQALSYEKVADVDFPVQVLARSGGTVTYIVAKQGVVHALVAGQIQSEPVLDISDRVRNRGEQGLLAAALHPTDTDRLFVHYSDGSGRTVLAEYSMVDPVTAERDSENVLLSLSQPAGNHNGGMIQFGPDGALYLGLGDGGGANDRFNNGQDTSTLLGSLVRVDVDTGESELFQYGLRNPWRFWIEGDLIYIADVGQGNYEEINVARLEAGTNYGWPTTEGLHCFRPSSGCDTSDLTLPVVEVSHSDSGTCSITGGVVYHGVEVPELDGYYFYSDYCGGYLRSLVYEGSEVTELNDWTDQVGVPGQITGFGVDGSGEMYVTTTDEVLKIVAVR